MLYVLKQPAFGILVALVAFGTAIVVDNLTHPHSSRRVAWSKHEPGLEPINFIPDQQPTDYGIRKRRFTVDGPGNPVWRPRPLPVATVPTRPIADPNIYSF